MGEPEPRGDRRGLPSLVEGARHSQRERRQFGPDLRSQRGNDSRIQPRGKEDSDRSIRPALAMDTGSQRLEDLIRVVFRARLVVSVIEELRWRRPPTASINPTAFEVDLDQAAGWNMFDARSDRKRPRDRAVGEVPPKGVFVDPRQLVGERSGQGFEGSQIAGKRDALAGDREEQWFLAGLVSREDEPPFTPVDDRKREHAIHPLERWLDAPGIKAGQQDFGITLAAESMPGCLKLRPEFKKIVDLPVVDEFKAIARRAHRLGPGLAGILNGQPAMDQADSP